MAFPFKRAPVPHPTIGFLKSQGIEHARVFCADIWCGHMVVVAFEDLGLPDKTPFPEIRTRRRWVCERCTGSEVSVMPDWHDPRAAQAERRQSGN